MRPCRTAAAFLQGHHGAAIGATRASLARLELSGRWPEEAGHCHYETALVYYTSRIPSPICRVCSSMLKGPLLRLAMTKSFGSPLSQPPFWKRYSGRKTVL